MYIPTTLQQDIAFVNLVKTLEGGTGYGALDASCVDFIRDSLREIGVDTRIGSHIPDLPSSLFNTLLSIGVEVKVK
ncbi:hypothetical protein L2755_14965 [Shewanella abyssi]|uniref:hypothetical protein n=1 Tax=Shewanella abyssi TaxID=311789 RepID=UPI00200F1A43|nr:hypothetical protein [Shewanella abyssi]MCL1050918.1 hypothetical protein [Shewanella abyssi]